MEFTPSEGLSVEYKGTVGNIKFIDEHYLTICTKPREGEMVGDICLVVYRYNWNNIKLMGSHHRQ